MYIIFYFYLQKKKTKLDPKGMAAGQRWYRMSLAVIENWGEPVSDCMYNLYFNFSLSKLIDE